MVADVTGGFPDVQNISSRTLAERYFAGHSDSLRPSRGEELIAART